MQRIDAAIFDIDGTLVDSVDLHAKAWQRAFAEYGRDVSFTELRAQIGKGGDQLLPVFLSPDEVEELGSKLSKARGKILKGEYLEKVRPFPGVPELFARLHADGIKIALASSAKKDELKHYVELLGISDYLDATTSTDDADKSKPFSDIFEVAIERLGKIAPEAVVVIGDTPYDAQAAARASIATIGLLCGGFPQGDLRAAGAIAIYQNPADLLAHYYKSPFATGRSGM